MDVLRARAYLDLLLGKDSRPRPAPTADGTGPDSPPRRVRPAAPRRRAGQQGPAARPCRRDRRRAWCRPGSPGGYPDRPAGDPAGPGRPARGDPRDRPGRPVAGPGPGPRGRRNPKTTWCVTVTDEHGHAIGHGCARPEPKSHRKREDQDRREGGNQDGPGFTFTATASTARRADTAPGGSAPRGRRPTSWSPLTRSPPGLRPPVRGQGPRSRGQAAAPVPGPARDLHRAGLPPPRSQADFEHNIPYEAGGRTCLCNGGPKCRHDHRLKQHPRWKADQLPGGTFRWTTPSGRQYTSEPTRYPV